MSRLRSYSPLTRRSEKRKKAEPDFRAVYAEVDRRSGGRCEVAVSREEWRRFPVTNIDSSKSVGDLVIRCPKQGREHHHIRKPRLSFHHPDFVIHVCRDHHERAEFPYYRGRLEILPLGDGRFRCAIVTSPDKFTYRSQGRSA